MANKYTKMAHAVCDDLNKMRQKKNLHPLEVMSWKNSENDPRFYMLVDRVSGNAISDAMQGRDFVSMLRSIKFLMMNDAPQQV